MAPKATKTKITSPAHAADDFGGRLPKIASELVEGDRVVVVASTDPWWNRRKGTFVRFGTDDSARTGACIHFDHGEFALVDCRCIDYDQGPPPTTADVLAALAGMN